MNTLVPAFRALPPETDMPSASVADAVVIAAPDFVAVRSRDDIRVDTRADIAGQPFGRIQVDTTMAEFRLRGALARSVQTCGALSRALELAIEHAQQREQFGRPIAKFQAVQTLISSAAAALSLAKTASQFATEIAAVHGFSTEQRRFAVAIAIAKQRARRRWLHATPTRSTGAIGLTLDHRLRHFTTRALAWRSEFGTQREWQHVLGSSAIDAEETVWELITRLSSGIPPNGRS